MLPDPYFRNHTTQFKPPPTFKFVSRPMTAAIQSYRYCLTHHTYVVHITPLVIYSLEGGHIDTRTHAYAHACTHVHTHTHTQTYAHAHTHAHIATNILHRINFKKPGTDWPSKNHHKHN